MEQESLGAFGEVDDPEEDLAYLDDDPIPFTLVGYSVKRGEDGKRKRHDYEFAVRPQVSGGALVGMLQQVDVNGRINERTAAQFLYHALIYDDQARWLMTLEDGSIEFQAEVLVGLAEQLGSRYGLRPTQPRSARRAGQRRTGTTSTAGRSGRASGSKTSTARTH